MPAKKRPQPSAEPLSWDAAREPLARLLHGDARRSVVDALLGKGKGAPLDRLRKAMRAHEFPSSAGDISLKAAVDALDSRSRAEGLHVMHGWDFRAQRRPVDIAPVLLLDYAERAGIPADRTREAAAILLDEYCVSLLALFSVRAWDDDRADERLEDLNALIAELNGPGGSGHRSVDDVGTLLILAVAYYHPEEHAYDDLLAKVWKVGPAHALGIALPAGPVLASHLRWGFRFMYKQDLGLMRDDNVVDYPWILYSLLVLARAYAVECTGPARGASAQRIVLADALVNSLSPDPLAWTTKAPAFLSPYAKEVDELKSLLIRHRDDLLSDAIAVMPTPRAFSPMSVGINFLSNAAVASATLALQGGEADPSLNYLIRHHGAAATNASWAEAFARRLMDYAAVPERRGAGGAPLIVYDPFDGAHHYNAVVRALQG
jgi:hypothetical protein